MNIDYFIKLPEQVSNLPEVGTMLDTAQRLKLRALHIESQYIKLLSDRDDFIAEVHELWTREERKGTGL